MAECHEFAGQAGAIRHTRPSAVRPRWWKRQKRFDQFPQRIGQQRGGHKPTLRCRGSARRIEPVLKMTGHKTDSVFHRYDIVSPDDLRIAAERLDAAAG